MFIEKFLNNKPAVASKCEIIRRYNPVTLNSFQGLKIWKVLFPFQAFVTKAVPPLRSSLTPFLYKYPSTPREIKPAFSLVEMLMALLVASLLLAALAPVMTRRFAENINISGVGGGIMPQTFCAYVNNGNELMVKDTETEGCIVPDNTYSMNVIMASGGGGGAGAVDSITSNNAPFISNSAGTNAADNTTYEEVIQTFDKSYKDFKITLVSGGGGSGGGNYGELKLGRPEKQSDCEPFGVYIYQPLKTGATQYVYQNITPVKTETAVLIVIYQA